MGNRRKYQGERVRSHCCSGIFQIPIISDKGSMRSIQNRVESIIKHKSVHKVSR